MAFTFCILVLAHRTADSDELIEALKHHGERRPTRFTLVVPCAVAGPEGRAGAQEALDRALERMREAGLEVDGRVAHHDPIDAVTEVWDPRQFDEIIVATLPGTASKWMQNDVPHRIARLTGVQVTHVLASDRREPQTTPAREREKQGLLSPLSVLTWGGAPPQGRRAS